MIERASMEKLYRVSGATEIGLTCFPAFRKKLTGHSRDFLQARPWTSHKGTLPVYEPGGS